jgi:tetratricopeptide (TPR) repeat protein
VGKGPEAEAAYLRAIALVEENLAESSDQGTRSALANLLLNRCVVLRGAGRFAEAEKDQGRVLALQRAVLKERPEDLGYLSELALGLDDMALLMRSRQPPDLRAAEDHCREALKLRQRLTRLWGTAYQQRCLAATCLTLGELLRTTNRYEEAVPVYREAEGSLKPLVTRFRSTSAYREQLVRCQSGLGITYMRTGKAAEARGAFRDALATYDGLPAAGKLAPVPRHEASQSANNLAWMLLTGKGRTSADEKEALALAKRAVELGPPRRTSLQTLAHAQLLAGKLWEAAKTNIEASKLPDQDSQHWFRNALSAWRLGNAAEARRCYQEAVRRMKREGPVDPTCARLRAEVEALLGVGTRPEK